MIQPSFDALGSVAKALLAGALVLAASYGLGSFAAWRTTPGAKRLPILIRLAVGINFLAWLGLAAGCLGWLAGMGSVALLIGAAALGAVELWLGARSGLVRSFQRPRKKILPSVAVVALITLGPALCYPTGWDELVYHHELPARWLADGWPAFYFDLPYSGFPSLGEVLFWLAAPLERVITPRLITWMCWCVGLGLVYRLVRRRLAAGSATVLTAAFAASGAVLMVSANCYVESILLMNTAAMLAALESPAVRRLGPWRQAAIVGVLAGGAAAIKLTGLAVALLPALWCARGRPSRPKKRRMAPQRWDVCLIAAGVFVLPFYLRPWVLTGNPFYPYYASWFTADAARLDMSRYHHALGAAFGIHDAIGLVAAPLLLAYDFELYDGAFGLQLPGLFILAAAALRQSGRRRQKPLVALPALAAVWLYGFWFLTAQQARFLIPAAIMLLVVAAAGLRTFRGSRRKVVLGLLLAATLLSVPWRNTGYYFGSWMTALGVIGRRDYVHEATDKVYLPLVEALAQHTPPDANVMILFEHRVFYLPRQTIIGTPFFQEAGFTPPEAYEQPEQLMKRLRDERITHVVITNAPAGPDQAPGWFERLENFLPCFGKCEQQGQLKVVWRSDRYLLLAVVDGR